MKTPIFIITGVAGSGKTTLGQALAERLGCGFYDGDAFHSGANITKMAAGTPLEDEDRWPWLQAINAFAKECHQAGTSAVIACSALKEAYRGVLAQDMPPGAVRWVHLQGSYELIHRRMAERVGHFMAPDMLRTQVEAYEAPTTGWRMDVALPIATITDQIMVYMEAEGQRASTGLLGLGVMGTSLARNIARRGFSLALYNRHVLGKEEGVAQKATALYPELAQALPFDDLPAFVASLSLPRRIILMVNAGPAIDELIRQLAPLLSAGDVLIDGGNSHYKDTAARQGRLLAQGIHWLGAGVSGGEAGALEGPAIMPGGSSEAFAVVSDVLHAIAARNEQGEVCCAHIGEGGAGHFVKMVHNGIEYAEMQLIAEVYAHLRYDRELPLAQVADLLDEWQAGPANSYLLGITARLLRVADHDGEPLLDKISDAAGQKGTGGWTTAAACELGVAVPTLSEALFARYLSSLQGERASYASRYAAPVSDWEMPSTAALHHTYMFGRIMNHHQGLALIQAASARHGWHIDLAALLRVWSGGCIIRSVLLEAVRRDVARGQPDMLAQGDISSFISEHWPLVQRTVSQLVLSPCAGACLSASLSYFKGLRTAQSSANLIQAQRDYFGAHGYQRLDDPSGALHHTRWD